MFIRPVKSTKNKSLKNLSFYPKSYKSFFNKKKKILFLMNKLNENSIKYNAEKITVLKGLEPVRRRPGVFIGSTSLKGLHHLVYEVIDNSVDEALAGYCSVITTSVNKNLSITVKDEGRGIPADIHPITGKTALETVMTILHAGGKFGGGSYKVSGGLHGVGISVVNGLSEKLHVVTKRDEKKYCMRFVRGKTIGEFNIPKRKKEKIFQTGTIINFKPDFQIFSSSFVYDPFVLGCRLNELAYLNSSLNLIIEDRRKELFSSHFSHKEGISEYILGLCNKRSRIHAPIKIERELKGIKVEIVFLWSNFNYQEKILSFANNIKTIEGGTHVDGFKNVLTRTINLIGRKTGKLKENSPNLAGDFIREGLTGIVSVKLPEPEFEGQVKSKLGNPDVRGIIDQIMSEKLKNFFEIENPDIFSLIIEKSISAFQASEAAKRAREIIRRKTALEFTTLPGKLADCSTRNPSKAEIFIVEGDSAGGSAKQARNRKTQAILPLRGKIINIEKTDENKLYKNSEIQALISALGLGTKGGDFDTNQLRYKRIIIMTDADVDGAHIKTLLLTFFYRYQRKLIESGFIFIACPPLYKIQVAGKNKKKTNDYCYSEGELEYRLSKNTKKINVQRFKGLGEMMPGQLWETTMDPSDRILKRVDVLDAIKADRIFNVLMGDKVFARKKFIQIHSDKMKVENIDF